MSLKELFPARESITFLSITLLLTFSTILYTLSLAIYRIYFSPLSHIPGNKLAIATWWYEFYYDVWKRGVYYLKVNEAHKKYGPIIRISPHEVHIADPNYYDALNNSSFKWDKYEPYMAQFNSIGSAISTASHDLHRARRKPENNFFSKASVTAIEPMIRVHVEKLCNVMKRLQESKEPFTVNLAMFGFATDVISQYTLGKSWDLLDKEDLGPEMWKAIKVAGESSHMLKQAPWLVDMFNIVPEILLAKLSPGLASILWYQNISRKHVAQIMSKTSTSSDTKLPESIIQTLLNTDGLSPADKSLDRLNAEAFTLIGAGGDTTSTTIATTLYHLVANPTVFSRLRTELTPLFASHPSWKQLEQNAYMSAVINEGLRINQGNTSRLARCAPDRETYYKNMPIPRNTPVSMTIPDIHLDPEIFPSPWEFKPERWLETRSDEQDDSASLQRYLVPFSKGTRICVGMTLAYAELFLVIATLVMRFDYELFETEREDVDFKHDFTLPHPRLGTKFIRVFVKERGE